MAKLAKDDLLARKLRAVFGTMPLDPLPPEFLDLLAQLDRNAKSRAAAAKGAQPRSPESHD